MNGRKLGLTTFLEKAENLPILDVRSPGEFIQGHIPGALSFPLFSDQQRAEIGTLYKQKGKEDAVIKGLEFVGPILTTLVRKAQTLLSQKEVLVHCWRGGMRSESVAYLLKTAGFQPQVLEGGYKVFRGSVLTPSVNLPPFRIIAGFTGSRKTEILWALGEMKAQILDLEAIAHHQGSTFGMLQSTPQPTQEQFENELFMILRKLKSHQEVWVEDESQRIGRVLLPWFLFQTIRESPAIFIEKELEERLSHLVSIYPSKGIESLGIGFQNIAKRLGGLRFKMAMTALQNHDFKTAAAIALEYYDKAYSYGFCKRKEETRSTISGVGKSDEEIGKELLTLKFN